MASSTAAASEATTGKNRIITASVTEIARGTRQAAVFGSVARGEERPDSDIDILLDFEPGREGTIYQYIAVKDFVAGLFSGQVDVIDRAGLKPRARLPADRDAIYAF